MVNISDFAVNRFLLFSVRVDETNVGRQACLEAYAVLSAISRPPRYRICGRDLLPYGASVQSQHVYTRQPSALVAPQNRFDLSSLDVGLFGVAQTTQYAIARTAYHFDTNMVLLLVIAGAFVAVCTVGVKRFKSRSFGTYSRDRCSGGISISYARSSRGQRNDKYHRINDRWP